MKVLGIETSCDETAAAVVAVTRGAEFKTLANIVASQVDLHRQYGGVVPEVAARSHLEVILPVIDQALNQAKLKPLQLDGLAVTSGPGLPGALMIGVASAKTLAASWQLPLAAVDHVHAHLYGAWLNQSIAQQPSFPVLGLIISGGHSQLALWRNHLRYQLLGQTQDDAVGEAFDKVSKLLGLGFPGGPAVAEAAERGNPKRYQFPIPKVAGPYDFSFSGLKTAVLRHLQHLTNQSYDFPSFKLAPLLTTEQVQDTAAAFQATAIETLRLKTAAAITQFRPVSVVVAGGVAANQRLRQVFDRSFQLPLFYPPLQFCTDNAAMIAALGAIQLRAGDAVEPLRLDSQPSLTM